MSINSDSSSGTLSSVLGLSSGNSAIFTSTLRSSGSKKQSSKDEKSPEYYGLPLEGDDHDLNASLDNSQSKGSIHSSVSGSQENFSAYEVAGDTGQSDYISALELKLFRQQRQHEEEIKRMKDQVDAIKLTSSKQIDALNREILQLKDKRYCRRTTHLWVLKIQSYLLHVYKYCFFTYLIDRSGRKSEIPYH